MSRREEIKGRVDELRAIRTAIDKRIATLEKTLADVESREVAYS